MLSIKDLEIDKEFQRLIRPLSAEEKRTLLGNISKAKKIRDPIKVWKGTGIIIDGHHRFLISKENDFAFDAVIEEVELEDRTAVKLWILKNQVGRRNLEMFDRARYTAMIFELTEGPREEVVEAIAKELKTSPRTVYRDLETQELLDGLPHKVRAKIEKGDVEITSASLKTLSTLPPDQKIQAMDLIEHATGDPATTAISSVSDAIRLVRQHALPGDSVKPSHILEGEKFFDKFLQRAPRMLDDRARHYGDKDSAFLEHCQAAIKIFGKHWRDWIKERS